MSVVNDLTDEERAEFAEHGVTFDGDPAVGPAPEPQPEPAAAPVVQPEPASPPPPPPAGPTPVTIETVRDPATGQFVARPVAPAEPAAAAPASPPPPPPAVDPVTGQPATPPPGYVPHQALHAERTQRAEVTRQFQLLQSRMNAMLASRPAPATIQMPDMETDPVGFLNALDERIARFEAAQQESAQFREIDNALERDEATYASVMPDYPQASDYYVRSRAQELLLSLPPEQVQEIMSNEVRAIAQQAWQRGVPAAAMIYDIAKARGYAPGTQPAPPVVPAPQPAAQAAPAPVAAAVPSSAAAVIASVTKGQQQNKSLGSTTSANATELNAEAILAMTDEEFEQTIGLGTNAANARFASIAGR